MKDFFQSPKFLIVGLLCVIAISISYGVLLHIVLHLGWSRTGAFGDTFGALNTLFTGMAFVGVLYSLALQRRQIKDSNDESFTLRTAEAKRDVANVFYAQLGYFSSLVDNYSIGDEGGACPRGMRALVAELNEFQSSAKVADVRGWDPEALARAWDGYDSQTKGRIGAYFRVLYRVLLFVDECGELNTQEKTHYAHFVRAQLSDSEIKLLFFNGLSAHGKKFKRLIEKYSLLKHIDRDLFAGEDRRRYYGISAYGDPDESADSI